MKKIIYILVALGLVLGMSVMATPALANVSNVTVVPGVGSSLVACGCSNWTISFTTTLALSQYQKVYVRFPVGTDLLCATCGGLNVSLWYFDPVVTMDWVLVDTTFNVIPYADKTQQIHITLSANNVTPAGQVKVKVDNVCNPPAGTYKIKASTEREPTEVESGSFTIIAGPTVSPTSLVWCSNSCKGVEFTVNWGSSCANCIKNITVNTCALNWTPHDLALGVTNITIDCGNLSACNLPPCAPATLNIEFCVGCNATIALTVAESAVIVLYPGWNLISLPLIPLSTDITKIFGVLNATEAKKVLSVWYWENACKGDGTGKWYVYKDGTGFASLTTMDACKSYWVCMNLTPGQNVTLPICGFKYPCPPAVPPKCCYCECWNMVGFMSATNMTRGFYLYSVPIAVIQAVVTFNASGWVTVNNDTMMLPGQGYWMSFAAATCIVPPTP